MNLLIDRFLFNVAKLGPRMPVGELDGRCSYRSHVAVLCDFTMKQVEMVSKLSLHCCRPDLRFGNGVPSLLQRLLKAKLKW